MLRFLFGTLLFSTAKALFYDWNGFTATTLGCGSNSGALNVGLSQSLPNGATSFTVKQIAFAIYGNSGLPGYIELVGTTTARLSTSTAQQCCSSSCDLYTAVNNNSGSWSYNSPCGTNSCGGSSSQNVWYYMDFSSSSVGTVQQTNINTAQFYTPASVITAANLINLGSGSVFFLSMNEFYPSVTPSLSRTVSPTRSTSITPTPTKSQLPNTNFQVTTAAGDGSSQSLDGAALTASIPNPQYMTFTADYSGIYFSEATSANVVRLFNLTTNTISTIAGIYGIQDTGLGYGTNCVFNVPSGLALDTPNNVLYIGESGAGVIRNMNLTSTYVDILAGNSGTTPGCLDGIGTNAQFGSPYGLALDQTNQFLYVADSGCSAIRSINIATKNVTTVAGQLGLIGWQEAWTAQYPGKFGFPKGIRYSNSNLYISDTKYNNVRLGVLASPGVISYTQNILGGNGPTTYSVDGFGTGVSINVPYDIDLDSTNNVLYVSQQGVNQSLIRKISLYSIWNAGIVTLSGNNITQSIDGTGTQVSYNYPVGLVYNPSSNNIYIADSVGNKIRKLSLTLPSVSPTASSSLSPTITITSIPTASLSGSSSITASNSVNPTFSLTTTSTLTNTPSQSSTLSNTKSLSSSISTTNSISQSLTYSNTQSISNTISQSMSYTISFSSSISQTQSASPSFTSTITQTQSQTITVSTTQTITLTKSVTPSITQSIAPSQSVSRSVSVTPYPSQSLTPSKSISSTRTATISISQSISFSPAILNNLMSNFTASPSFNYTGGGGAGATSSDNNPTSLILGSLSLGLVGAMSAVMGVNWIRRTGLGNILSRLGVNLPSISTSTTTTDGPDGPDGPTNTDIESGEIADTEIKSPSFFDNIIKTQSAKFTNMINNSPLPDSIKNMANDPSKLLKTPTLKSVLSSNRKVALPPTKSTGSIKVDSSVITKPQNSKPSNNQSSSQIKNQDNDDNEDDNDNHECENCSPNDSRAQSPAQQQPKPQSTLTNDEIKKQIEMLQQYMNSQAKPTQQLTQQQSHPPRQQLAQQAPKSQPASQPKPQPATQPKPQPATQPKPQAAPQPKPQPAPQPKPQPAPQPKPQPAPQPKPQPAQQQQKKVQQKAKIEVNAEELAEIKAILASRGKEHKIVG